MALNSPANTIHETICPDTTRHGRQVATSLRHDADLSAIAQRVLYALDWHLTWEQAPGADALRTLMPEFRRVLNGGMYDPTRCPQDDLELEQFEEADEGGIHVLFQCAASEHVYRGVSDGMGGWSPRFDEVEVGA